jgi:hypothetical protein
MTKTVRILDTMNWKVPELEKLQGETETNNPGGKSRTARAGV